MTTHCNETLLTIFANLTPWVQGISIGGVLLTIMVVAGLLTRTRRLTQEHVHYVAQAKPE